MLVCRRRVCELTFDSDCNEDRHSVTLYLVQDYCNRHRHRQRVSAISLRQRGNSVASAAPAKSRRALNRAPTRLWSLCCSPGWAGRVISCVEESHFRTWQSKTPNRTRPASLGGLFLADAFWAGLQPPLAARGAERLLRKVHLVAAMKRARDREAAHIDDGRDGGDGLRVDVRGGAAPQVEVNGGEWTGAPAANAATMRGARTPVCAISQPPADASAPRPLRDGPATESGAPASEAARQASAGEELGSFLVGVALGAPASSPPWSTPPLPPASSAAPPPLATPLPRTCAHPSLLPPYAAPARPEPQPLRLSGVPAACPALAPATATAQSAHAAGARALAGGRTQTSRYRGVSLKAGRKVNRWKAVITVHNQTKHLGYFPTDHLAAAAYASPFARHLPVRIPVRSPRSRARPFPALFSRPPPCRALSRRARPSPAPSPCRSQL